MQFNTNFIWPMLCAVLSLVSSVAAFADEVHPLGKPLQRGVINFELRDPSGLVRGNVAQAVYRPYRQSDIRKDRRLNVPWAGGPKDLVVTTQQDTQIERHKVHVNGSTLNFTVPLHAAEAGFEAYQLYSVQVGRVQFGRWFPEPPALAPEFGLASASESMQGTIRLEGIAAEPLRNRLPLWPALRTVRLDVSPVEIPTVRIWNPLAKHHWDGWRDSPAEFWSGGKTTVMRRVDGTTVWRVHEYSYLGSLSAVQPQAKPMPSGAFAGIGLEVYWPQGDRLEFPDVVFRQSVLVFALRVTGLTARARDILARSARHRPGVELQSVTAAEWDELVKLEENLATAPAEFSLTKSSDGKDVLVARRRKLVEPWVYVFGSKYDSDRRYAISALVLDPKPWSGPLPQ